MIKTINVVLALLLSYPTWAIDLNRADIIGKVGDVTIASRNSGAVTFVRVYFTSTQKDRFGCVTGAGAQGYIEITDADPNVSSDMLNMIYSQVLTAQTAGKSFGSGGPSDCNMNNFGVLFDDN